MSAKEQKKILIVDDHPFIRKGVSDYFEHESDLEVCAEAAGISEALEKCSATNPNLVLVDLSLGDDSGLDLVKDMVVQFPETKTIILSMKDEMLYAERAFRAGASGYVSKDADPDDLIQAVRCVLEGGIYASPEVHQKIMQSVHRDATVNADPIQRLSDRELMVFESIGSGMGTTDIANKMSLSVKTIETYRERIKNKLDIKDGSHLVQQAIQWVLLEKGE